MNWLELLGVAKGLSIFAQPILEDLAKDTSKELVKGFFTDLRQEWLGVPEKDVLKKAYCEALIEFSNLMEQELKNASCEGAQIEQYVYPVKKFVESEEVNTALGKGFNPECKSIDSHLLSKAWQDLNLITLPEDFEWIQVSKPFVRSIKKIIAESEDLRSIYTAQSQSLIAKSISELAMIAPEFDLRTYAEGLQEQYGNVKLESLDANTTNPKYSELKLREIFIPQKMRECQYFSPQVYELPKEYERKSRNNGQSDKVVQITKTEVEQQRQAFFSQVNRSILEIVAGDSPVQKVVILGDPGAGKSSLLQYLALIWAKNPIRDLPLYPIPLLIELRTYAIDREVGICNDILTFIHTGNITCRLDQQQLHEQLKKGHAIALFDGIDEVFDPGPSHEFKCRLSR